MKSKEFLKVANALRKGFMDGIKSVLNIQSPSKKKEEEHGSIIQPDSKEAMLRMEIAANEVHPETTCAKVPTCDDFMQAAEVIKEANTRTPVQEIAGTLNRAAQSYGGAGAQVRALIRILSDFSDCMSMGRFVREQTNNWKKMHGQPMKRRTLQERRRKSK